VNKRKLRTLDWD